MAADVLIKLYVNSLRPRGAYVRLLIINIIFYN